MDQKQISSKSQNYWWVNHKQTFKKEFEGGYIWSPHKNKNGAFNQTYKNLTLTRVGDVIFSFADAYIQAIGIIEAPCVEAAVPPEFGSIGDQWNTDGYLVKVSWTALEKPFKPKEQIQQLKDLLPEKHSPIQTNGNGNQSCYLASISELLAHRILALISKDNTQVSDVLDDIQSVVDENQQEKEIIDKSIPETQKEQLIKARRGQGLFRNNVIKQEKKCRVTGVTDHKFLIASHIKPWAKSTDEEKLDGNNGLLLSPHIDKLFDKGWISFTDEGDMLISTAEAEQIVKSWNIPVENTGPFNAKQKSYLRYHREKVFGK